VVAFEVPRESGARHRVTAIAEDGARAEAFVREEEGVARAEGEGFAIEALETYPADPARPSAPKPVVRRRVSPPRWAPGAHASSGSAPSPARSSAPAPPPAPTAKPIGSVKDGFTKLQ